MFQRIAYLRESLRHPCAQNSCRGNLQTLHAKELESTLEQRSETKALYRQLLKEKYVQNEQIADKVMEFVDTVRKPFRRFLHAQNLVVSVIFHLFFYSF
jgi:hypothetical protein